MGKFKPKGLMFKVPSPGGRLRWTATGLIKRFPRLPEGVELEKIGQTAKYASRTENGEVPRGYGELDKKWKKIARMVASGESIRDVCKKMGCSVETFYRRRKAHKLFRAYLMKCFDKAIGNIPNIQNRQVVRAVNIVGEAMESTDPYFRYDVAHKHLRGMGKYSTSQQIKKELSGSVEVNGAMEKAGIDKDIVLAFVQGIVEMSRGKPINQIDIVPEVKQITSGTAQIQDGDQREAS